MECDLYFSMSVFFKVVFRNRIPCSTECPLSLILYYSYGLEFMNQRVGEGISLAWKIYMTWVWNIAQSCYPTLITLTGICQTL